MTLDTRVYVRGEIEIPKLLRKCQELLLAQAPDWGSIEDIKTHDDLREVDTYRKYASREMGNKLGQDLPAWLEIRYGIDGEPYRCAQRAAEHSEDCEEGCDGTGWTHRPWCFAEIMFDTAYGYRDGMGGCGALHARLLFDLGGWLDVQGIPWGWNNEFTGEDWFGDDRYQHLPGLIDDGEKAQAWFRDKVAPVIMSAIEEGRDEPGT